ncbi:toxin-activating lysine-acyltransferase [Cyanothece sp. BG0011]|uniref:toxin-activating lysine-acyltransferase n=1 Tax=Cyanothece sp. BG0011 TaxID=2082950 RepID=UPI000D1D6EB8|nr:toxin-activating lysine-acyltransferase [Cyanothece sp. BG0011]
MLQEHEFLSPHLDEVEMENPSIVVEKHLQMIGSLTHLMMSSKLHQRYQIIDISGRFLPSLIHNQFRYCEMDSKPLGFVNWAWLSDEVEEKFKTGKYVLKLDEWQSGNNLWFLEFIAPFGHANLMIKDLRNNILPKGTPAKSLRIRPDGTLRSIAHWRV